MPESSPSSANIAEWTNIIVAITSLIAILIALVTFWHQNRQARTFLGIEILRESENAFFYSDRMMRARHITCQYFSGRDVASVNPRDVPAEAWFLLDHFDSLAYYVNNNIVEHSIAWTRFYYWLDAYWHLMGGHLPWLQTLYGGARYLEDLPQMYEVLTRYGTRHKSLPPVDIRHSDAWIAEFLRDELRETEDGPWAR